MLISATSVAKALSFTDFSMGQSGGTEAYFVTAKRDFYKNFIKMSTQKYRMSVKQRVWAQRGNKAAKLISALSKISYRKNIKTRFNRFQKFHH